MEAKDLGIPELSDQALVKIFLTDVNDNAPKIQPKQMDASVLEVIGFYFVGLYRARGQTPSDSLGLAGFPVGQADFIGHVAALVRSRWIG